MALSPKRLAPSRRSAPKYSPLGYTRLWCLTTKSGAVSGTASTDTGRFAVKWWDNSVTTYWSGETFTKSGGGLRAFDVYPIATTTQDVSVNANDAILIAGAQITSVKSAFPGLKSLYVDGTGDYVTGTVAIDWNANFTLTFWYLRGINGSGAVFTIFQAGDIGPGNGGPHLYVEGSGVFSFNNGFTAAIQGGNAPLLQWVHVAVVRNNGVNTLYINGASVGTSTQTFAPQNSKYSIGGAPNYGFYTQAYIDDFRIVAGQALYTTNFTPPTAPSTAVSGTVLLLPFENAGTTPYGQFDAFDVSSNALTQVRAEQVELAASPGYWGSGYTGWTSSGSYQTWVPGPWVPGALEQGNISDNTLSSSALNTFYTDLLAGSGALYVAGNPGIASDTPTIAANKGYTVYGSDPATVVLMNFNGTDGFSNFVDNGPFGLSVDYINTPVFSSAQSRHGGTSAYFDGQNSYLEVATGAFLDLDQEDFTAELWLRFVTGQGNTGEAVLFSMGSPTDAIGMAVALLPWNGTPDLLWMAGDGWQIFRYPANGNFSGGNLSSNQWNHIALTRKFNKFRLFANGNLVDTVTLRTDINGTNLKLSIGGRGNYNQPLTGYIEDLRIIKGAALYASDAGFTPPTNQLGVWP